MVWDYRMSQRFLRGPIDCINERDKKTKQAFEELFVEPLPSGKTRIWRLSATWRYLRFEDHRRARYHEIEALQCSDSSAAETVSRMGMPEMLSAISVPLAVLCAKEH